MEKLSELWNAQAGIRTRSAGMQSASNTHKGQPANQPVSQEARQWVGEPLSHRNQPARHLDNSFVLPLK